MSRVKNRLFRGGSLGVLAFLLAFVAGVPSAMAQSEKDPISPKEAGSRVRASSRDFLENKGQWEPRARFLSRLPGVNYWVTSDGLVFDHYSISGKSMEDAAIKGHVVGMSLLGSKKDAISVGLERSRLKTDFLSADQGKAQGARSYGKVLIKDIYADVDLKTYVDQNRPRYDFYVRPGGDPGQIKFGLKGANSVRISNDGELIVGTDLGDVKQADLFAYQTINGKPVRVPAKFVQVDATTVAFELGAYDKSKTLVIDPLVYGSYYGGDEGWDEVRAVVADADGGVFITGGTRSPRFPNIFGPYGFNLQGRWDAYVSKFQGDAYHHDYCAFVGGSLDEVGDKIQVDPFGDVWIAGRTESSDFPGNTRQNVQYLRNTLQPPPDGGHFRLQYGDDVTNQIPWNASAALVQSELEALPSIGPGNITATGGPLPTQIRLVLDSSLPGRVFMHDHRVVDPFTGAEIIEGIEPHYVILPLGAPAANPQILHRTGSNPLGGTFTLTFDPDGPLGPTAPETTVGLPFNATSAEVQTALEDLGTIGAGNVACTGGPMPGNDITITFQGTLAGAQPLLVVDDSLLFPWREYHSFKYSDIFVQRWKKSATSVLDPLPTRVLMIGEEGLLEKDYDEPPGQQLQPFGRWANPIPGFRIVPKDNPAPTDPVEIILASNSYDVITNVTGAPGGDLDGFIYRMNFENDAFTTIPGASKFIGSPFTDDIRGLDVDAEGSIYVSGTVYATGVTDTAINPAPFQTTAGVFAGGRLLRGWDSYVRKYARDGTLVYSALIGGNGDDSGYGVAVDDSGNAYIVSISQSFNFPRTRNVFGENFDSLAKVAVTKINLDASEILYSTHLRTNGRVWPKGIQVDNRGQAFVAGMIGFNVTFPDPPGEPQDPPKPTASEGATIPTTPDALQSTHTFPGVPEMPTFDGFLLVLNQTATDIVYGTYIGGLLDEQVFAPFVDRFGDVWVVGSTDSSRTYIVPPIEANLPDIYVQSNIALPAQWLSPNAFKLTPDASPQATGIGEFNAAAGLPYGSWYTSETLWQTIANANYRRDGFLVKLRVGQASVENIILNPSDIAGGLGAFTNGTVVLTQAAPPEGLNVILSLNNASASFSDGGLVSSMVLNIPGGATTGNFTVYSNPVSAPTQVEVKATLEGSFRIRQLTIEPWLTQLTVTPTVTVGGNSVVGRVRLFQPATQDMTIALSTDNSGLISFPPSVTVLAGQDTATFPIETEGVISEVDVPITASFLGVGRTQFIRLTQARLLSVTFDPARVTGGSQTTGKVTLDGEAGGTFTVTLSIDAGTPGYVVNPTVLTFNQGDREKTFTVDTVFEPVNTQRRITATRAAGGGWSASTAQGTLFIDAANLIGFTVSASSMPIGGTVTGTVTISAPAATGGAVVTLASSDPSVASVPASVVIPAGSTSATFDITATTTALTSDVPVTITATRGPTSIQRTVTVLRTTLGLNVSPSVVVGGQSATGTVTLGAAAPAGGVVVSLSSNNAAVSVPASVTVAAGQTQANFTITTTNVTSSTTATITATAGSLTANVQVEVRPIGVLQVLLNPQVVRGGTPVSCTVRLDAPAPAGGADVMLSSSNSSLVILPNLVTVPAGQTEVTFTLQTRRVSRTLSTVITATYNGKSASATLTVRR